MQRNFLNLGLPEQSVEKFNKIFEGDSIVISPRNNFGQKVWDGFDFIIVGSEGYKSLEKTIPRGRVFLVVFKNYEEEVEEPEVEILTREALYFSGLVIFEAAS